MAPWLFLVAVTVGQNTGPPLPTLPDTFEAWVACNIINKNYTVTVHEVYDATSNRAMLSMYHPVEGSPNYVPPPPPQRSGGGRKRNSSGYSQDQGASSTLYDYTQDRWYHRNSTTCVAGAISNLPRFMAFARGYQPRRIPSVSQWFAFGNTSATGIPGQTETYMGTDQINGVAVNWWRSDLSNATANTTMILDYYFTLPTWQVWNGNGSQLPVMLNLTGSRPNYVMSFMNGTMVPTINGTHDYAHNYLFNGFHVGPPRHDGTFMLPAGTQCVSTDGSDVSNAPVAASSSSTPAKKGLSTGGVIGVAIISAVIGALVAVAIIRKNPSTSPTSKNPTFHNALANVNDGDAEA